MWLKISYDEDGNPYCSTAPKNILISIDYSVSAPMGADSHAFRLSPIFPLVKENSSVCIENTIIHFFEFTTAYRVLGRIDKKGTNELKNSVFFSIGLASIILITDNEELLREFRKLAVQKEIAYESWVIEDFSIKHIKYEIDYARTNTPLDIGICNYDSIPLAERAIIDEFKIGIKFMILKLSLHMPNEIEKFQRLVKEINELINELVFLSELQGSVPELLKEFNINDLKETELKQTIWHQNIDRIIQVNSALSYISTQAFSGAIPILERRSLIRRNSLLGIGSGILALNRIARFIENSFSIISLEEILTNLMSFASPLEGLDSISQYKSTNWYLGSVNIFPNQSRNETGYYKLPFFSGRLGYRETEYAIAAALQSITSGASLEWSLMTVTHEMLHGHVRKIIAAIFFGNDNLKNRRQQEKYFYEQFRKSIDGKIVNEKEIDSIRKVILLYCSNATTHGSISNRQPHNSKFDFISHSESNLWMIFSYEYRNISEIFVHVLDLHYFYASRIAAYIPLIWCSWLSVPHISGDLRQYILRSMLTIASKTKGTPFLRFKTSITRLKELLQLNFTKFSNVNIIEKVILILDNFDELNDNYFPAFKNSLIIVDLITNVFISDKIRSQLMNDDFINLVNDDTNENSFEQAFEYALADGFNDDPIRSPLSYLLDRMNRELHNSSGRIDTERETAIQFLALNSHD